MMGTARPGTGESTLDRALRQDVLDGTRSSYLLTPVTRVRGPEVTSDLANSVATKPALREARGPAVEPTRELGGQRGSDVVPSGILAKMNRSGSL